MVQWRMACSGSLIVAACLLASMVKQADAVNRCGTSFAAAGNQCKLCPGGVDGECGPGERCYADLPNCSASPPSAPQSGGTINRCGTSFADAGTKCNPCPGGVDSECGGGERCYADLPSCSGGGGGGSPAGGGPPPSAPLGSAGSTYATLLPEQKQNARTIIQVGKDNNIPERGWVVALATAMQESKLLNLDFGDQDSQGLFQQRPSQGWGSIAQIRDPVLSSEAFYGVSSHTNNPGLLQINGWEGMTIGQAAQAVQVSEFPDRYAQWEPIARELVANN